MDSLLGYIDKFGALVVSVCALGLTVWQGVVTRKHNKLSVRPAITSTRVSRSKNDGTPVSVLNLHLINQGLGPAFIKSFDYLFDGQPLPDNAYANLYSWLSSRLNNTVTTVNHMAGHIGVGHVMKCGDSFELAIIPIYATTQEELALTSLRLHVRVTYESAYGELFTYDSRQHEL